MRKLGLEKLIYSQRCRHRKLVMGLIAARILAPSSKLQTTRIEPKLEKFIPFAALLAVMAMGTIILEKNEYMAHEISKKLSKLWVFAEILLFALVGAQVNIKVR